MANYIACFRRLVTARLGPSRGLGGGGPLIYHKFLRRFWRAFFEKHNVPYVTPHAARRGYSSTLQLQGVELGVVAKLMGQQAQTSQ